MVWRFESSPAHQAEVAKVVPPQADLKNVYTAYVLYSEKLNKYYYGSSANLEKRLEHHNLGLNRWSKRGAPWSLVSFDEFPTKSEALKREKFFKSGKGRDYLKTRIKLP